MIRGTYYYKQALALLGDTSDNSDVNDDSNDRYSDIDLYYGYHSPQIGVILVINLGKLQLHSSVILACRLLANKVVPS